MRAGRCRACVVVGGGIGGFVEVATTTNSSTQLFLPPHARGAVEQPRWGIANGGILTLLPCKKAQKRQERATTLCAETSSSLETASKGGR